MNFHDITAQDPTAKTKQDHAERDYIRDERSFAVRLTGHFTADELRAALACVEEADKHFAAAVTPERRIAAAARMLHAAAGDLASEQTSADDDAVPVPTFTVLRELLDTPACDGFPKWVRNAVLSYNINRAEVIPAIEAAITLSKTAALI